MALNTFKSPEVFYKKAVVKNLAIFTEKQPLLESLFNSEYCEVFKSTYFEEHLRTAVSENVFIRNFNFILMKQVKMFVFIS